MLRLGGIAIEDGDPLKVGDLQIKQIMLGGDEIWTDESGQVPSEITDFEAINGIGEVTVEWSNATGDPIPVYDLFEAGSQVETAIDSGFVHSTSNGSRSYYVNARNTEGTVESNSDIGISGEVPSEITDFEAIDGIDSVTMEWSNASGYPLPTYDLYRNTVNIETNIDSGFVLDTFNATASYYVKAINILGDTDSNSDDGTSEPATEAPSEILDFAAWDAEGMIGTSWTPATGTPTPTYDLYQNDVRVVIGIEPNDEFVTRAGVDEYYVLAKNSAGEEPSNTDWGVSGEAPIAIDDFVAHDGIDSVTVTFSDAVGTPACTYHLRKEWVIVADDISSGFVFSTEHGTATYDLEIRNPYGTVWANSDTAMSGTPPQAFTHTVTHPTCSSWTVTWTGSIGYPEPTYTWTAGGEPIPVTVSPTTTGCTQGWSGTSIMTATNQFGSTDTPGVSTYCNC